MWSIHILIIVETSLTILKLKCYQISTKIVEISEYAVHFRSGIFQNTGSLYNSEFSAPSEYPEFHNILILNSKMSKKN